MYAIFLSVLLSAAAPAHAGDDGLSAANSLSGTRFAAVADQLGLDADQRKEIADLVYRSNAEKVDIDARVERARLDLRHLLAADTIDEKAVLRTVDALSSAEADLRKNRVQLALALRRILLADQWAELTELRQERRTERRAERHTDSADDDDER